MTKLTSFLLVLSVLLAFGGVTAQEVPIYPIYELPTQDLPDLYDSSLEDWEDVLPGTSLTHDDFAPLQLLTAPASIPPTWLTASSWPGTALRRPSGSAWSAWMICTSTRTKAAICLSCGAMTAPTS